MTTSTTAARNRFEAGPRLDPTPQITTVLIGDDTDGINVYARRSVEQGRAQKHRWAVVHVDDPVWRSAASGVVHVHLTDRLVDCAPLRWASVVEWTRLYDVPLVVTLHDIPQAGEGAERIERRAAALRCIAGHADLVVVSSRSEQSAARRIGIECVVVNHPIFDDPAADDARAAAEVRTAGAADCFDGGRPTIGIAGFVHPGKGVATFVEALGDVRGTGLDGWQLRLIGAPSTGHADEPARLEEMARRNGLDFVCTGSVTDGRWTHELRSTTVAVCPHLHCSASGSILSWIGHGRTPLTTDLPFARELAQERRGAVTIVARPSDWMAQIVTAAGRGDTQAGWVGTQGWRTARDSMDRLDHWVAELLDRGLGGLRDVGRRLA